MSDIESKLKDSANKSLKKTRVLKAPKTIREQANQSKSLKKRSKISTLVYRYSLKPIVTVCRHAHKKLLKFKLYRLFSRICHYIGLIIWPRFIRNAFHEIALVEWPTTRETFKLTFAVIVFSVFIGAFVASLDFGLTRLFKYVILK